MFRYADTGKVSRPKESQRKVVTKLRKVTYYNDSPNPKVAEPVVTFGTEIVEEQAVSSDFLATPEVVESKTIDNRNPNRVVERDDER